MCVGRGLINLKKNEFRAVGVASSSCVLRGSEVELGPARRTEGGNSHLSV